MTWQIFSYRLATLLCIVAVVSSFAAFAFEKLRKRCNMTYKHCCVVNAVIAIILYFISDKSPLFILYAGLQILALHSLADFVFIPHLINHKFNSKDLCNTISLQTLSYGIIFMYFALLNYA